jgi:hypothetical protein
MPDALSPALGLVPGGACLAAPLPPSLEGEQHLAAEIPDLRPSCARMNAESAARSTGRVTPDPWR